ncbi:MAG TPA: LON peptidase substrate-binding domain-containing protein [Kiritimatiellia bacterium]|nr:LON peptidase substrate-binding domain-containing protein [Kiritimatiellia bacterium]
MSELPIFALPLVACPRELVPLHIFEPRYKAMMAFCLDEKLAGRPGEFVILPAGDDGYAPVGCVVQLIKVIKQYENGRMDIMVHGKRRVAITTIDAEGSFPTAETMAYEDLRGDWDEDLATRAFNLHRALIQMITGTAPDDRLYTGVSDLSFLLAATVSLDVPAKLRLLKARSEDDRLRQLADVMSAIIKKVEDVQLAARAIQSSWELQKLFTE